MGVKQSQLNYRNHICGADGWAKSDSMRASYKKIPDQAHGDMQGKAAVILTND